MTTIFHHRLFFFFLMGREGAREIGLKRTVGWRGEFGGGANQRVIEEASLG